MAAVSGNPAGRPIGSRNRLTNALALYNCQTLYRQFTLQWGIRDRVIQTAAKIVIEPTMNTVIQLRRSQSEKPTVRGGRAKNADCRQREYLTEPEIKKLLAAAGCCWREP